MNTVLITVDSLRADHLSQYGYHRETMPALDRISEEGTVFEQAFSNGPYTRTSVPSFHTSTLAGYRNIEELTTIASALRGKDVYTAFFGTNSGHRSVIHGLGFDEYHDLRFDESRSYGRSSPEQHPVVKRVSEVLDRHPTAYRLAQKVYDSVTDRGSGYNVGVYISAADVTDETIEWLEETTDDDFFLWLHYMEAHRPYGLHDPDPAYTSTMSDSEIKDLWKRVHQDPDGVSESEHSLLIDQYDSNLRYCSRHLDRLFDTFEEQGLWEETNILFSSDHGEEFHEHGLYNHHNLPYDELLSVPLLARGPDIKDTTVTQQRELLDIGPTILDFHGADVPSTFQGENLFEGDERQVITLGASSYDEQVIAGRWDGWKFIWRESEELLFNLDEDPGETNNVVDQHPAVREHFLEEIPFELFDTPPEELREPEDEVDRKRLKALGYID